MFAVAASRLSSVFDKVEITSDGFAFDFIRGLNIAAKASSVTVFGKFM